VQVNGQLSEPFDITTGVLQGNVLALFLFVIVVDFVMSKSEFRLHPEPHTGSSTRGCQAKRLNDLDFEDDVSLQLSSEAIR
jgi:hypothetical protein